MRTIVDIPENMVKTLDEISSFENRSRAALIREALKHYLSDHYTKDNSNAYGIWRDEIVDGVEFQRNIRSEWSD
ncbi:MAG: ribbon-helix-helix protein, CopG family [Kiritimatiellia bacterium]